MLDATSKALYVINAMTSKEAVTDYSPEAVEAILSEFNGRVLQAIQDEDRVDDTILHGHLREAIVKTMEDPDSSWSAVTTRGTSPTPVGDGIRFRRHTLRPRLRCMVKDQELSFGHLDILKPQMLRPVREVIPLPLGKARVPVRTLMHV